MSTLTDLPPFFRTQCPLLLRPTRFTTSTASVFLPFPSRRTRIRCSIAKEEPAISSPSSSTWETDRRQSGTVDCVVVGGGISGLCIAQALATKHSDVVPNVIVTEARDHVGGNIVTVERDGYLWEEGPNSFQPSDPMLTMVGREESVEEFVRRNLGDEVFERLIEPFCSGVYAGDPSKLSMKAAFGKVWKLEQNGGSIIGGTFKSIQEKNSVPKSPRDPRLPKPKGQTVGSFRKGLAMLPNAISKSLGGKVKLSWKLSSISKLDKGGYNLTYETPQGLVSLQSNSVVMTVPSHVASSLLRPLAVGAADALSKFYYPPVASVSISYPKEAIRTERLINGELNGFGQLHPRSQGVETLGTIYSSSLFPNRAPAGRVLLLNYIGGATNPGILSKTETELVEAVDRDLRKILIKPNAKDPLMVGVRKWPQAIPQFLIGHLDLLDAAKAALRDTGFQGLFLGGNYVSGVALGRCVEGAYEVAAEVTDFLSQYAYK
ncbi:hypothetical protein I3843_07G124600 [Carya illinoinensis]|uniref:Protoporphyrinogen oxidase n=1 Tax=Carya illinoinensis TaxID=32201 RepID=A0A922EK13_CARIL|nr:hypothetical protein I3760_07G125400 [Carya illinoinensis]KAG6704320.1 hypothetical protein I3842_07G129600 [Carya illinoinensis]KAG7971232.1 hypothetical protein I3843_07G124600 [Carya illinoinensis]